MSDMITSLSSPLGLLATNPPPALVFFLENQVATVVL